MRAVLLFILAGLFLPWPAMADDLSRLLEVGPLVRVETDEEGRFRQGLAVADIDAPPEAVWQVLTDFTAYPTFMPRIERIDVRRTGTDYLVAFELDTPLVSTRFTNRYTLDLDRRIVRVRQVEGDLKGSRFEWRIEPRAKGSRVFYSGVVKNFSTLAQSLDDEQQSMTIAVNVVSLLSSLRAVKERAEKLYRGSANASRPRASGR